MVRKNVTKELIVVVPVEERTIASECEQLIRFFFKISLKIGHSKDFYPSLDEKNSNALPQLFHVLQFFVGLQFPHEIKTRDQLDLLKKIEKGVIRFSSNSQFKIINNCVTSCVTILTSRWSVIRLISLESND